MDKSKEIIQDKIEILGMTCIGCARTLENELRKFPGIKYTVNFQERSIIVTYSTADYKREDFETAIESHGYKIKGKTY